MVFDHKMLHMLDICTVCNRLKGFVWLDVVPMFIYIVLKKQAVKTALLHLSSNCHSKYAICHNFQIFFDNIIAFSIYSIYGNSI